MSLQLEGDQTNQRFQIDDVTASIDVGYSEFDIKQVADRLVDELVVQAVPNTNMAIGDEIEVIDTDNGNKLEFGGYIANIDRQDSGTWRIECDEYVVEVVTTKVKKVYENQSPEDILQDLIDNNTSLTFNAPVASNVTLDKYVIEGPIQNAIEDMTDALNWQVRSDAQKNFYFEPRGRLDSSKVFTQGDNCRISSWKIRDSDVINTVELRGGRANYRNDETFSSGSTSYNLARVPVGNVKVTVGGTVQQGGIAEELQSGDDYYIDQDNAKLIFDSTTGGSVEIQYTYELPIVVEAEAQSAAIPPSQREVSATIKREWIKTFQDARQYAREYVENHSQPERHASVSAPFDPSPVPGRLARVVDDNKGIDDKFVVEKKTIRHTGWMDLEIGTEEFNLIDWQHQVQQRIEEIEKDKTSDTLITQYRSFDNPIDISVEITGTVDTRPINDSFILGHPENGDLGDANNPLGDRRGSRTQVATL